MGAFRALLCFPLIIVTLIVLSLIVWPVSVVLFVVSPCAYRFWVHRVVAVWQAFVALVFELGYGMRYVVSGNADRVEGPVLVIANHRTRLDWALLWPILARYSGSLLRNLSIVTKDLRQMPFLGWSLTLGSRGIFLSRRWQDDEAHLSSAITHIIDTTDEFAIMLFPEGTDMHEKSLAKSAEFAERNSLPQYRYLLHPRTTGVAHVIAMLHESGTPFTVMDVTMGFRSVIPQNERVLVTGATPSEVHASVHLYSGAALPKNDAAVGMWVAARWFEKEQALREFYERNAPLQLPVSSSSGHEQLNLSRRPTTYYALVLGWVAASLAAAALFIKSYPLIAGAVALAYVLFFAVLMRLVGGMDRVELRIHGCFGCRRRRAKQE
jgi:lysocardiolipin and lysophospholipid acyltransferase